MVSHRSLFDPSKKEDDNSAQQKLLERISENSGNDDDIEGISPKSVNSRPTSTGNTGKFVPPMLRRDNNASTRSNRSVRSQRANSLSGERPMTAPRSLGTFKRQSTSLRSIGSLIASDKDNSGKAGSTYNRLISNDTIISEDDDEDEDVLGIRYAIFWLFIVTIFISILSDMLVETIQPAATSSGMSNVFLSAIVIPIIGNAAEHASAVIFGLKNKLDLSLAIAVGSATQIAAFLIPLIVIIGWIMNVPMSWDLQLYEVASLVLAVLLVGYVVQTGTSTWLDGVVLIGGYIIVSGAYWAHVNESDIHE